MKNVRWTARARGRIVGTGTLEAEDERDALRRLLAAPPFEVDPSESYALDVGGMLTSSYGDEFERTADAAANGADDVLEEPEPVVSLSFTEEKVLGVHDGGAGVSFPDLNAGPFPLLNDPVRDLWKEEEERRARATSSADGMDHSQDAVDYIARRVREEVSKDFARALASRMRAKRVNYQSMISPSASIAGIDCPVVRNSNGDLVVDLTPAAGLKGNQKMMLAVNGTVAFVPVVLPGDPGVSMTLNLPRS